MGLIFVEGFECYDQAINGPQIFGASVAIVQGSGGAGTRALRLTASGPVNTFATGALPTGYTYFAGFTLLLSSVSTAFPLVQFRDGATLHGYISVNNMGFVEAYQGNGTKLGTSLVGIFANQWYHMDIRFTCHATNGFVQVRVDGQSIMSLNGVNTKAAASATLSAVTWLNSGGGANSVTIDDLYVVNSQAVPPAAPAETYLGPAVVEALFPTEIGDFSEWQPIGAGQNYQAVSTIKVTPAAIYLSGNALPGDPDLRDCYQYQDLVRLTGIRGVSLVQVSSGHGTSVGEVCRRAGVTAVEAIHAADSANLYYRSVRQYDPCDTGSPTQPWTVSNLNATQFGPYVLPPP